LLKSARPEVMAEIAAEMAAIRRTNPSPAQSAGPVKEFFGLVKSKKRVENEGDPFMQGLIDATVGREKSGDVLGRIQKLLDLRDPFKPIRELTPEKLAKLLKGESPQVASLVLSELPPRKSSKLLELLEDNVRAGALRTLTQGVEVSPEAKLRIASAMTARLEPPKPAPGSGTAVVQTVQDDEEEAKDPELIRNEQLRKVAVLIRGLELSLRNTMIESIAAQDKTAAEGVRKQMVIWEDLPLMPERPMQEVLRTADARQLALAMVQVDGAIAARVRECISERARAALDEETSLLSKPKPEDITAAREKILTALRAMNDKGELPLEEK
jgi:flagellar motor switch protein FliG